MFLRLSVSLLLSLTSLVVKADITKDQGARLLLDEFPNVYQSYDEQYFQTYQTAEPLFQKDKQTSERKGKDAYIQLESLAQFGDKYSQYHLGHVQLQYKGIFNSSFKTALTNLQNASQQGVVHAQYALGLAYKYKADEVAKILSKKKARVEGYESVQLFLKGAEAGYGPSFLMACRDFEAGSWFDRNIYNAEKCYLNALRYFDQKKAMSFLANLYLFDPVFSGSEFEFKGLDLAQEAAQNYQDEYAMALWGRYLLTTKNGSQNPIKGKELLNQAIKLGSADAKLFLKKYGN